MRFNVKYRYTGDKVFSGKFFGKFFWRSLLLSFFVGVLGFMIDCFLPQGAQRFTQGTQSKTKSAQAVSKNMIEIRE